MAITQLTKTEFSEKIANLDSAISEWHYLGSRPAIVDFYATWCGPCRTLAPILEELSEEYAGEVDIYKVDIDREQELAAAFGVRSVPTLLFIGNFSRVCCILLSMLRREVMVAALSLICSVRILLSRLMATTVVRRESAKCCCKVMKALSICFLPCRIAGLPATSVECAYAAVLP